MARDARKDIQAMVERVIPGQQLGDIIVERKIALSYVTTLTEDKSTTSNSSAPKIRIKTASMYGFRQTEKMFRNT